MGCKYSMRFILGYTRIFLMLTRSLGACRHVDLKGNLIKAMMVINWLNMIEVEGF